MAALRQSLTIAETVAAAVTAAAVTAAVAAVVAAAAVADLRNRVRLPLVAVPQSRDAAEVEVAEQA